MKYSVPYPNVELFSLNVTDDVSRVKLSVQTHSTDDYINANYMPVSGERGSLLAGWRRSSGLLLRLFEIDSVLLCVF